MTTLDMDRIAKRVADAGFAAYVEQTGGGCATIYASREWEERPVTRMGEPAGTVRMPKTHPDPVEGDDYPRHDVVAGPGYFAGENWTQPRASVGDFSVCRDGNEDVDQMTDAATEDAAVETIVRLLTHPSPCTSPNGLECTNPEHDHRYHPLQLPGDDEPEAHIGEEPMCEDCGLVLFYCKRTEDYWHTDPTAPECFLVGAR